MGLISRVSSRTYRNKNFNHQKWADDQPDATATVKTNPTQNRGSTVVFRTQKSEFSISVTKKPTLWPSQFTSSWYPTNMNKSVQKHSKLLEFQPINTWQKFVEKTLFI